MLNSTNPYVQSVFDFKLQNKPEILNWKKLEGLKDVPTLFAQGRISEAEAIIAHALKQYPTYGFCYVWQSILLVKKGAIDLARHNLTQAIHISNEKDMPCGHLGRLEFDHGCISEAVKWWTRSAMLQFPARIPRDAESFLFLAHVASFLGNLEAGEKLEDVSALGARSVILLDTTTLLALKQKLGSDSPVQLQALSEVIRELIANFWNPPLNTSLGQKVPAVGAGLRDIIERAQKALLERSAICN